MQYRRAFTPGGTFFFTLVTQKRQPVFASADAVDVLRSAFRTVRASRPFHIDAMVVSPTTCIASGRYHPAMPIFRPACV